MEYWSTWIIVIAIGLVMGFVVHALIRYAQGSGVLATMVAGVLGSIVGSFALSQGLNLFRGMDRTTSFYLWGVIGAIVLSIISELLFVGSRRGRIVTS